jgi:hypothetical protein
VRAVIVMLGLVAALAVGWLVVEARALHAPPPPPVTTTPPAPTPPPATTTPAQPPTAPPAARKLYARVPPTGEPAKPPAEPAQPPSAPEPASPDARAAALARVQALLGAVTRVCRLPRDGDRGAHLVFHVATTRDRVQSIEHGDGALPDGVVGCIDRRLQAARWPAAPGPLTLDVDVRAADLP